MQPVRLTMSVIVIIQSVAFAAGPLSHELADAGGLAVLAIIGLIPGVCGIFLED
jgi:hypothetical protein